MTLNFELARLRALPVDPSASPWQTMVAVLPVTFRSPDGSVHDAACGFCATGDGAIATSDIEPADALDDEVAIRAFVALALEPVTGSGRRIEHLPPRVLVGPMPANARERLSTLLADLGIVVESTATVPAVEAAVEALGEHIAAEADADEDAIPSILDRSDVSVARFRAFCEAAAIFHDARPWTRLAGREVFWSIEPRPHRRVLRHVAVIGAASESVGLAFLSGRPTIPASAPTAGMGDPMFETLLLGDREYWSVTFDEPDHLPPDETLAFVNHGLPVAAPDAFPLAAAFSLDAVRRPGGSTLTFFEGILRATAGLSLRDVRRGFVERRLETFDGERTIRLTVS